MKDNPKFSKRFWLTIAAIFFGPFLLVPGAIVIVGMVVNNLLLR